MLSSFLPPPIFCESKSCKEVTKAFEVNFHYEKNIHCCHVVMLTVSCKIIVEAVAQGGGVILNASGRSNL